MDITKIKSEKPYNSLFSINPHILNAIKENMEVNGFDVAFPIITWRNTIIDGHTRYNAASLAGITEIPVKEKEFNNEQEALEYAIHNQRDRRNITDAELIRCVEVLDKRNNHGGDRKSEDFQNQVAPAQLEKSHQRTAEILGIGERKVSDLRTIIDSKDSEVKQQVEAGEKSVKQAAIEIRQQKKQQTESVKCTFNRTNDNIEWAKWTWNPVTGCHHDCKYCYARDIANRFYPHKFEPHFYPERLDAPKNTKISDKEKDILGIKCVFVVSMGDLFGEWVKKEWIDKVINSIKESPEWNYILLTKNPKRYLEFTFPKNCWLGATADNQARMDFAVDTFSKINHPVKFVSCEPLMERIEIKGSGINWIIIGGRSESSGMREGQPEWEWVEHLLLQARFYNMNVYFKPNLTVRPKEYPNV
jgi:protein gp37